MKCDKEKPNCKRFMKWQGFCGGYDVPLQAAATSSSTSASLNSQSAYADAASSPGERSEESVSFPVVEEKVW